MASQHPAEFVVHVTFEPRDDGGLRARCDKIPDFFLSHSDPVAVRADVIPALQTILSGMYGRPMSVRRLPDIDEALNHQPPIDPQLYADESYLGHVEA